MLFTLVVIYFTTGSATWPAPQYLPGFTDFTLCGKAGLEIEQRVNAQPGIHVVATCVRVK